MHKKLLPALCTVILGITLFSGCQTNTAATLTPTPTIKPTLTNDYTETKVTLGTYKGLTLYEVDSAEVAQELRDLLESYAELVEVNRAAAKGDVVNINYTGKKDGVILEDATETSESGYNLELGSESFINGFEDNLLGAAAGEVREFSLTFPEDYYDAEFANQEIVFTVTINTVLEKNIPEASDAFAEETLGYGSWSEYVLDLYAAMNRTSYFEQITEYLMASCQVENYPASEINYEIQEIYNRYYNSAQSYGSLLGMDTEEALYYFFGFSSLDALKQYAEETAYETVKNSLILVKIAEEEGLSMKTSEYQSRLEQYAARYGYETTDALVEAIGQSQTEKTILLEYVMDYILSQATIVTSENDAEINQVP